jgi:glycosyltransferase involved in cell wall biosynthesis
MGSSTPLVSVIIPTLNSERCIRACLESIRAQTCPPPEVIVVDSRSPDATVRIAAEYAKVMNLDSSMTRARIEGARAARGTYILNLDSDQRLSPSAIQECVATGKDVVALGEEGVGRGLVAFLNTREKEAQQRNWRRHLDPEVGAIRPRFYRRDLFLRAAAAIPTELVDIRPSPFAEDSLFFLEASKLTNDIAFLPKIVYHEESMSVRTYVRKWFRYGRTASPYVGTKYASFVRKRGIGRLLNAAGGWSIAAIALRSVPFALGDWAGLGSRRVRKRPMWR